MEKSNDRVSHHAPFSSLRCSFARFIFNVSGLFFDLGDFCHGAGFEDGVTGRSGPHAEAPSSTDRGYPPGILLLILSFKNKNTAIKLEKITGSKNDTNGHSAVIVLVSIFILSLLCMLISGLTSGIIEILEIINSNK